MRPIKRYTILVIVNLGLLTIFVHLYQDKYAKSSSAIVHYFAPDTTAKPHVLNQKDLTIKVDVHLKTESSVHGSAVPKSKFQDYNLFQPQTFRMKDDHKAYFKSTGKITCFIEGTDWDATIRNGNCSCLKRWHGEDCGIPDAVWRSIFKSSVAFNVSRRSKPRRVINAINVNHELEMLEGRVHELREAVDVYLIGESNYTAYGDKKPLRFLKLFQGGFLKEFQPKIVYVFQDVFPATARNDGWVEDSFQRTFLSTRGLKQLQGLRGDDIYLQSDADEIPKREVILFLKLYDNYLEPIILSLTWTIYGFFWWGTDSDESTTYANAACSVKMLQGHFGMDGINLRRLTPMVTESDNVSALVPYNPWQVGSPMVIAGWHCSWCFLSPEGIRTKLISAQNGDSPRWGDYPEKTDLDYLRYIIKMGVWFDNETAFEFRTLSYDYAPEYFMRHFKRFQTMLVHPNASITADYVITN